ncbi:MAG: NAD(P)/FAD-dependent oxidoreductase [Steroidobacteraceae bacterium]
MMPVAIIGAGLAGLACARRLAESGVHAVLFDKARGVGGRVATRRAEGLQFDHGAQYVTARDREFAKLLGTLEKQGAAGAWQDGGGPGRWVGVPGMSALPKALGVGLDVRLNQPVTALIRQSNCWQLQLAGTIVEAARVIVTVPAPQALSLLGESHPLSAALRSVAMAPCLTLMAATRQGAAPFNVREDPAAPLAWIARNSSKPGRASSEIETWVAQAGPEFSTEHLEKDPQVITSLMLPLLCEQLGVDPESFTYAAAHRWRYARVIAPLGEPFLRSLDATLYLGGDWCLGARVEAAWTSGIAMAEEWLALR